MDFDVASNKIFALTKEKLFGYKAIGFNYQLPNALQGIKVIKLLEQSLKIAAIQRGRTFSIAVLSDKTVF